MKKFSCIAHSKSSSLVARNPSKRSRIAANTVHQNINTPVVVDRTPLDQLCGTIRLAQVEGDAGHAVEGIERLDRASTFHHAGALVGQHLGHGKANTFAGTGGHRDPVGKFEIHDLLLSSRALVVETKGGSMREFTLRPPAFDVPPSAWPSLPVAEWQPTRDTLQLWTQVVGKVRLQNTPPVNHWWHTTLYVNAPGLTTSLIPYGDGRGFEMEFDFSSHVLRILVTDGSERVIRSSRNRSLRSIRK